MEEETRSEDSKKPNSLPLIIGIVVVLIILLGAAFAFGNKNSKNPTSTSDKKMNMQNETMTSPSPSSETSSPSASNDNTSKVKTFTIIGSNFKFQPNTMTVNEGDTVNIKFKSDNGFHDFVLDEFNVKTSVIGSGKEEDVSFVANKKGTFQYYCSVGNHRAMGMFGTLTVL